MNIHLLKEACTADAPLLGVHLSVLAPELIELCGYLGFRWVFLDAEHQPLQPQNCYELVRAADGMGLPCIVRVPKIEQSMIEGFLDAGILGIVAPIHSPFDDARDLVAAAKFAPAGRRGAASRSRAANYGLTETPAQYYARANGSILVAALIESKASLDALEVIAAEPGLDCIAMGPNDLGLSMGIQAGAADPNVRALVAEANDRIQRAGKPQITVVSSAQQARESAAHGARLIAVPDASLFAAAGRDFLRAAGQA